MMRSKKSLSYRLKSSFMEYWQIYLLLLPVILYFVVFDYFPMYGVQIAFKDFLPTKGITGSPWVGLKHFKRFFSSPYILVILKNTISISLYSLVAGFPLPILFALLLNHQRVGWYRKFVQTASYAPHFISTVVLVGMMKLMMSPTNGVINALITALGGDPIYFFGRADIFYSLYVWSGVWTSLGWSAIVYVGALSAINPELHEAAKIDGASIWKRIHYIDLPGILPTVIILLILRTGDILTVGFEKIFLMQNNMNAAASEVISTYVYKQGLVSAQYSYSAAVGLLNSAVNFLFLVMVNFISGRLSDTTLF